MPTFVLSLWNRLLKLEELTWKQVRRAEARRYVEISQLSHDEVTRLDQLWAMREEGLAEAEQEELFTLLGKCRIGGPDDLDGCGGEDGDENEVSNNDDHNGDGIEKSSLEQITDPDEDTDGDDVEDQDDENDQDNDIITEWEPITLAFVIAFHRYAFQHPEITFPDWDNLLHKFLILTGCRLFIKYGWAVGQHDCSTITPLERWRQDERQTLITLYERSDC